MVLNVKSVGSLRKRNGNKYDYENESITSFEKLNVDADVNSCSMGEAKSGLANYDLVLASTHIIKDLKGGPNTKMVGLLNLLDANELEAKLKEVGIG